MRYKYGSIDEKLKNESAQKIKCKNERNKINDANKNGMTM